MKKLLLIFFALFSSLCSFAYDVEIDGIYYNLIEKAKTAEVMGSPRNYGAVTIPSTITVDGAEYSVTSIGHNAFQGRSDLPSVTIPNSITSIGYYAFEGCSGLTSVTIPNSVTSIEYHAFWNCSGLNSVHISDLAAWCNISFESIYSNPLYYAHHLYINGEEIKDLVVSNSITSIGDYTFSGCSGLNSVTIPNSVTIIGNNAFRGCSGLTSVSIPHSVTSIGDNAFRGCFSLTSVSIPDYVTSIGDNAFRECSALTSISLPNSVTIIGSYAFYGCSGLTSVSLPNSVTRIESYTFYECSSLTSVSLPNSVVFIGESAFERCSNLASLTLGNSLNIIASSAFYLCKSLTSVIIPNSVTNIGDNAFRVCTSLTSVSLPNSVTSIGARAFCGCKNLEEVYCYADYVPSTEVTAFNDSYVNYATLYVPRASINNYSNSSPWSDFGTIKAIEGEPVQVETITLNHTSAELHVGNTLQLTATIAPEDAEDKSITWTSSNTDVATVSETGLVTAKALGNATITATAGDGSGVTASCAITVSPVLATSITLNQTTIIGNIGENTQLSYTILPANTTNKEVAWESTNQSVATVDQFGIVTFVGLGSAVITVKTTDGSDVSAQCSIVVTEVKAQSISLNYSEYSLYLGESVQLIATILPENTANKNVIWSSSNEEVMMVSSTGKVTCLADGVATITATTCDGTNLSASCVVERKYILVESIELNYDEAEIHVGETLQLEATILPEDAENKEISWASGANSIATVDENGLVTAVSEGSTTIVATAQDGSEIKGYCSLTVLEVDGILNIVVDDAENISIYSPDGKRLEKQHTGVNIIRNADGTVRKVFKKK